MILSYFYEDNLLINPFIVSYLPENQNSLILSSKSMSRYSGEFLEKVSIDNNHLFLKDNSAYLRAFMLENKIIVTLTFVSDKLEKDSGRKGLHLTLGVAFNKKIFLSYIPCQSFFQFFILKFESIFNLSLHKLEADKFIDMLLDSDQISTINKKLEFLYKDLSSTFFFFKKISFLNKTSLFFKSKGKYKFPSLLLIPEDKNYIEIVYAFLHVLDIHLQKFQSINVSTLKEENSIHCTIIPVLPIDVNLPKKIRYFNTQNDDIFIGFSN